MGLRTPREPILLETPTGVEGDAHLGDFIEDKGVISADDAMITMNLEDQMRKVLATCDLHRDHRSRVADVQPANSHSWDHP